MQMPKNSLIPKPCPYSHNYMLKQQQQLAYYWNVAFEIPMSVCPLCLPSL